jgi:hypothetical protein
MRTLVALFIIILVNANCGEKVDYIKPCLTKANLDECNACCEALPGQQRAACMLACEEKFESDGNQCELTATVLNPIVSKGEELIFKINLYHALHSTATTPLYITIYDKNANIVFQDNTSECTIEHGETLEIEKKFTVPSTFTTGTYYLTVGVEQMKQGALQSGKKFQVVE